MAQKILISNTLRFVLSISSMWPYGHNDNFHKTQKQFIVVVLITLFVFSNLINHLIVMIKANEPLSEDIALIITSVSTYANCCAYVIKLRHTAFLLQQLSIFENAQIASRHLKLSKVLDSWAKLLILGTSVGLCFNSVTRIFDMEKCNRKNLNINCGMSAPCSTWKKLSMDKTPVLFSLYYAYEAAVLHTYVKAPLLFSCQLFEMVQHIILNMQYLEERVVATFEQRIGQITALKKCLCYHSDLIKLTDQINDNFKVLMLLLLISTSAVIGSVSNCILQELFIALMPLVLGWIVFLFIACFAGQLLTDASVELGDGIYASKWYNASCTAQKLLLLFIKRTQKPLRITTGKFNYLSFSLFTSIMKASYSLLTLLNS